jgi:hypothetical protein
VVVGVLVVVAVMRLIAVLLPLHHRATLDAQAVISLRLQQRNHLSALPQLPLRRRCSKTRRPFQLQ